MTPEAQQDPPPWRPILLADYEVPALDARQGVALAWSRLWKRFEPDSGEALLDPESVPADVVAHLIPEVDLERAATALAAELDGWRARAGDAPRSVLLVGPPGSAVQDVLATWARRTGLEPLPPPTLQELDAGSWTPELPRDPGAPLVLPPLERLFLRRAGGLDLVRALVARLQREQRAFACASDSWSWAFLSRTLVGRGGFDRVLTSAPFDGAALRSWLEPLGHERQRIETSWGQALLEPGEEVPTMLRELAARARGIPRVAAGLWRLALCDAQLGARREGRQLCRMPAWSDVEQPDVPQSMGKPAALLLHALLVHDGLDADLLPSVQPLPSGDAQGLLWDLAGHGVVGQSDGRWHVTTTGYPAARAHLGGLNLPLDAF